MIYLFVADDESPSRPRHHRRHAGDERAQHAPFTPIGLSAATILDWSRTRARPEREVNCVLYHHHQKIFFIKKRFFFLRNEIHFPITEKN